MAKEFVFWVTTIPVLLFGRVIGLAIGFFANLGGLFIDSVKDGMEVYDDWVDDIV